MNIVRVLVVASFVASLPVPAVAKEATLTGKVGDAMCGARHTMTNDESMCTRECVKKGSDYALVVGDKVYALKTTEAQQTELGKLAGKVVTVKGDEKGNVIQVASISPVK